MTSQISTHNNIALDLAGIEYRWPGKSDFSMAIERFRISQGESVLLLGESGSGKSTLLSLISGIIQPDAGTVIVGQTDLGDLTASGRDQFRAENIGIIFQMFNLLPNVTPLDNVLLPLHFAPARKSRLNGPPHEAAVAMMDKLGLPVGAMKNGPASRLSVGQQQRVAVARALIGQPPLVIADEPTSALDATSQAAFLDLLFEQIASAGSTLLMVSHDARLGERFSRTASISEITTSGREVMA